MMNRSFPWLVTAATLFGSNSFSAPVQLQNATATFSQANGGLNFLVSSTIDGLIDQTGWAIFPQIANQTAAFQTANDIGTGDGTVLTFSLIQGYTGSPRHNPGRFRLSVTTDPRNTFCDGLQTGGDVSASWSVLQPYSASSANGTVLTRLPDQSVLASGINPVVDTYTVAALTDITNITGIRLEVLQDPSLPHNGPGRYEGNGNFVLSEFKVDASAPSLVATIRSSEVEICWLSVTNKAYEVDYRSDVTTDTWMPLVTNVIGNGVTICVNDRIAPGHPPRFYRVVAQPR
jgi:hypothetical protein